MSELTVIERQIASLFLDRLHLEIPSPETDLFATGAIDSMAFVDLLVRLEERFGIEIELDQIELDNFRSIRAIAEFVAGRTRERETA